MAKRKQRALARKKTASKPGKARARAKSAPRKAAKRASAKTRTKKTAKRAGPKTRAKKAVKAKKQATKARAKRAAFKKAAPRPTEPPRQPVEAPDETVIVDIIEEPVPGVVVVIEFESVRTRRPETLTPRPEGGEGSGLAERGEGED
jgi:hypothetical protein